MSMYDVTADRAAEIMRYVSKGVDISGMNLTEDEMKVYTGAKKTHDEFIEKYGKAPVMEIPYGMFKEPEINIKYKEDK